MKPVLAFSTAIPVLAHPLSPPRVSPAHHRMELFERRKRPSPPSKPLRTPAPSRVPFPPRATASSPSPAPRAAASASGPDAHALEAGAPLRLTGNNIALTESLRAYVEDKLGKVTRRFPSLLTKVDVHLTVEHNRSIARPNKAEVVAFSGKTILRTEVRSDDMYAAIDDVEVRISRTIRKFKERKESKPVATPAVAADDEDDDDDDDDGYTDVYADVGKDAATAGVPPVQGVVRRKVFPMPLQTVDEAVLCCEYVDHPWYLFRNADTKEISLVYKRNHGGYGLIEPSNPDIVDEELV